MRINSLKLRQYRNIDQCDLEFPKNMNVFVGNNGQGKTNVIESIVYLSSARSFRVSSDKALIQHNQAFCEVCGSIESKDSITQIRFVLSNAGKYLTINKSPSKRLSNIMGLCNVVLFNPDDINFFSFAPRKRRREIDFEMGKLSQNYVESLSLANKLLLERNSYLKEDSIDRDYLKVISESLIDVSGIIMKERKDFLEDLETRIESHYHFLSDSEDSISLEYKTSAKDSQDLRIKMEESLKRDKDYRTTHIGIHRDDYIFKVNGIPVVDVSSQGQKRILVLSFKFALVEMIKEKTGFYPILCLDDLFSELDEIRRKKVLELIDNSMQVFISTTDLSFIQSQKEKDIFYFQEGRIHKEGI